MRILLTSARAPVTLDLARRLNAMGDSVFLCDHLRFPSGRFTKSAIRFFATPAPNQQPAAYIETLNQIIQKNKIELLIPTCEEIFFIAALQERINCDVLVGSAETLQQLHNKWIFSQLIGNSTVRVPESIQINSTETKNSLLKQCDQFVFKPVYSRFAAKTLICPSAKQLQSLSVSKEEPWVAQRFVSGREVSTYSIASDGVLAAHCVYRSLFRAGIGSGICIESEVNQEIKDFTIDFVRKIGFTGQIGFDFIVDRDGNLWVLEANPRSTSGIHLFDDHGLTDALKGKSNGQLIEPNAGNCKQIFAAMLTFGLKDALKNKRLSLYLKKLCSCRDVIFSWPDPVPFLALPLTLGELCWTAAHNRIDLQQASTFDIEYNGESI